MVGFYKRRDPLYNKKATLHKSITPIDGSSLYYDINPKEIFYFKDDGFETTYTSVNGHTEKQKVGKLETIDLKDGAITPEDYVMINGEVFIVTKVKYVDNDIENHISKRPSGKTIIDVRN